MIESIPVQERIRHDAEDLLRTGRFLYLENGVKFPPRTKYGNLVDVLADRHGLTVMRIRRYLFAARFSPLEALQWYRAVCGAQAVIPVLLEPRAPARRAGPRHITETLREITRGAFGVHAH